MIMKNTRTEDLGVLEEHRDNAETVEQERERIAMLITTYEQSKDPILEKLRRQLTEVVNRQLYEGPTEELHRMRDEIERKVKAYASSDVFKNNLARKIAKYSTTKANKIYTKGV